MAGNVGFLNIGIGANTKSLQSGLKTASGMVKSFAGGIKSGLASVAAVGATALAAVGAGSLTGGLVSAASSIDDIAKKADTLGIGTEELIGLRHGANLAGVGAEELDTGLGKMLNTIGEAQTGSSAAVKSIENLGLSISDLQGLSANQQFGVIADAINSFEDPALRAAAAQNIFGRGFMQMMPFLASGSAGIAAAATEAERLGMTFSRLDAAKVEGMNDAFSKLSSAVSGVFQKISIELAPVLESAFSTGADAVGGLGTSIATFVAESINEILFFVKTWDMQWELMSLNAQVALETIDRAGIRARKRWTDKIFGTQTAEGPSQTQIKRDVLMRDITAQREQWEKLREVKNNALKPDGKASAAAVAAAGLGAAGMADAIELKKSIRDLTKLQDESAFFTDMPATEVGAGVSSQLAAATQFGTTEGAQAVFGAITARANKENEVANNTAQTAQNTLRTTELLSNLNTDSPDMVDSFLGA